MEKREKAFLCPFCGGPYRELIPAGVVQVKCRYCGATVLVPPRLGGSVKRCPNHPEALAIGFCNDCGESYCDRCLHTLEWSTDFRMMEIYVCPKCLMKRRTSMILRCKIIGGALGLIGGSAVFAIITLDVWVRALAFFFAILFISGPFWIVAWYFSSSHWMKPTVHERHIRITEKMARPEAEIELYERLREAYLSAWGTRGKRLLESKIEAYVKHGSSRKEAILKVAKDEGYVLH